MPLKKARKPLKKGEIQVENRTPDLLDHALDLRQIAHVARLSE